MPRFTVRDWLRQRLDVYEARHERRDEEFADLINRNVDALSNRRTLLVHLVILAAVNALVWLTVLIIPHEIADAWLRVRDIDDKVGGIVIAVIFGVGTWLTYALFRLKFPDLESPEFEEDVLASFQYSQQSMKQWRIWLASGIGGVLNVLALFFAEVLSLGGL